MSEPIIAAGAPIARSLEAGQEYHWCACGRSKSQPFCDGSHVGTEFTPVAFTADADEEAHLCACKRTGNAPYCDGSHARFSAEQVGTDGTGGAPEPEPPSDPKEPGAPTARPTPEEPTVAFVHRLAREGLSKLGDHGPMTSMGVPRKDLPRWDDLQVMVAQMATKPLLEDVLVGTELVIGPEAEKPLRLDIPLIAARHTPHCLRHELRRALGGG